MERTGSSTISFKIEPELAVRLRYSRSYPLHDHCRARRHVNSRPPEGRPSTDGRLLRRRRHGAAVSVGRCVRHLLQARVVRRRFVEELNGPSKTARARRHPRRRRRGRRLLVVPVLVALIFRRVPTQITSGLTGISNCPYPSIMERLRQNKSAGARCRSCASLPGRCAEPRERARAALFLWFVRQQQMTPSRLALTT